jgi:hypothetical protein
MNDACPLHAHMMHTQTLARENRREYGRLLLELWVNQVRQGGVRGEGGRKGVRVGRGEG